MKLLILTDHTNHSSENSLYPLAKAMRQHPKCTSVEVATRGLAVNDDFFKKHHSGKIFVSDVTDDFTFTPSGKYFSDGLRKADFKDYDAVWLRMPPPLSKDFLNFLNTFSQQIIINNPDGIWQTGSKRFLLNFPTLCPTMQVCDSIESIIQFKNRFPIVLKPFREYGGKGIVRIDGDQVWEGKTETTFNTFIDKIKNTNFEYLGVKFLKNVTKGDKRVIVVGGKILGASLRLPAKDSWICNVAMGGNSNHAIADEEEIAIVKKINPTLQKMGIVMYGVDTLVNDDGQRILSELNTTSIGGLPQIAALMKEPLVEEAVELIWEYIVNQKLNSAALNTL
jgi:glutathione synthase